MTTTKFLDRLTEEEAIKSFREMWRWLSQPENAMKEKMDWPGWQELLSQAEEMGYDHDDVVFEILDNSECFLCLITKRLMSKDWEEKEKQMERCEFLCPLNWNDPYDPEMEVSSCCYFKKRNGLIPRELSRGFYSFWENEDDPKERARLAGAISLLPLKDEWKLKEKEWEK